MHLELRSQLAQRSFAADRLDRHPRFELRIVLFSRRRHRPLLCQRLRRNLSLLPGLKSRVHYSSRSLGQCSRASQVKPESPKPCFPLVSFRFTVWCNGRSIFPRWACAIVTRPRSNAMTKNMQFENEIIELDGQDYESCSFADCIMVYRGGTPP